MFAIHYMLADDTGNQDIQNTNVETEQEAMFIAKEGCCRRLCVFNLKLERLGGEIFRVFAHGVLKGTVSLKKLS